VTQGPLTAEFERLFAVRHKVGHALATTSCTAALHLATMALEIGRGDEVIVPAFTWVTSAHCAEYVGARVVFADVELSTYNLDPKAFEAAITERSRAVVVVHLFGLSAKLSEILDIARRHNLFVIEDAACAVGTTYDGKPVGGFGDVGCFSFHPRKVVTTGEGGMVTTHQAALASKIRSLRNHGSTGHLEPGREPSKAYAMSPFDVLGFNLRLSDIQAAVGIAQMHKLDALLSERRRLAGRYTELLHDLDEVALPVSPPRCSHTYQSYVIRVLKGGMARRNKIMDFLSELKIQTRPGTHAVHRLGYYAKKYKIEPDQFPVAAMCEDTTITLPLFPGMTEDHQRFVVSNLKQALRA
jgi:dTDP-4-amino-4,6-dideoxygalactose transaminase